MIDRKFKLRWRRRIRYGKRQVEDIGFQAEEQLEQHFLRRLGRITQVRRFVASWLLLFVLSSGLMIIQIKSLNGYYQKLQPVPGGTFTEGILGSFTNANPIYATSSVDSSVSRLVFDGLLKYDQNNKLVPDLADSWSVDGSGLNYVVKLKDKLQWQDGVPLTASDVVFTYQTIQNPDARSPLLTSWQGINVTAIDNLTVRFALPNTLSSFPYGLTNGIIPQHLLKDVNPEQLRSSSFNTVNPVGSGPFRWDALQITGSGVDTREERIGMIPNLNYYAGPPRLQHYIIRAFHDSKRLETSLANKELNAVSGLDRMPPALIKDLAYNQISIPLTAQVMVFFKTNSAILKDVKVRQALIRSIDQPAVLAGLGYPVIASKEPVLPIHFAYNKSLTQLHTSINLAGKLLDSAGWKLDPSSGLRFKHHTPLHFSLYSESNTDYSAVAQQLQKQWRAIGVDLQVILESPTELQTRLTTNDYDSLLYGISLGADPDVFPYWASSQARADANNAFNFSQYKSAVADAALEAGRTRQDPALRTVKYKPFLTVWRNDAPALALYQPRFLYITYGKIYNLNEKYLNVAADRYSNVNNWMIREAKVNK